MKQGNRGRFVLPRLCCVLILISLSAFIYGLDPGKAVSQYIHDSWQVKDGLPQNTIFAITQTTDGYIWIGTTDGLVRFDGVNFDTFSKLNTPAITNNKIFSLCTGKDGSLWVGTGGGGLVRFKNNRFTRFSTADGLSHDFIRTLFMGHRALWIGTEKGLCRLEDGVFKTITTRDGLSNNSVRSILQAADGSVWIGTAGGGLDRLQNGVFSHYHALHGLPSGYVRALYQEKSGRLWIGTFGTGVYYYENGVFSSYTTTTLNSSEKVLVFQEDKNGGFWIGTAIMIARLMNLVNPSLKTSGNLSLSNVLAIFEDQEGSLWIGTYNDGLHRLRDARFTCFTTQEGLSFDNVLSVYEDRSGVLWLGTSRWLSHKRNGDFSPLPFPDNRGAAPVVLSIGEDKNGGLWFGTLDHGLFYMNDGILRSFTIKDGLGENWIRAVTAASQGGVWVGTNGGGLDLLNGKVLKSITTRDGLSNNIVLSIIEDRDLTLWIGTNDGLNRLKDGVFTIYRKPDGLSDNTILTMYRDSEGILWLGTNGGLNCFHNGRFTSYTTKEGLKNDSIYQILEDSGENFWMLCGNGVLRVSKRDLEDYRQGAVDKVYSTLYGRADGMKSTQSNQGGTQPAAWKTQDGKLWFASAKGVAMIEPNQLTLNTRKPPVIIEKVFADGVSVEHHTIESKDKPASSQRTSMHFAPGIERFKFHFTALSFLVPERVKFRYILEGYETRWREGGTARSAQYMNIPPGQYTFRVIACNNDGIWNTTGASFRFYLEPFIYQTWWFYVLSGMLLIVLSIGVYRWRIDRLKQREEELAALVARRTAELEKAKQAADAANKAKSRFLAQMSHEIRTPLNSIIGFSDLLMEAGLEHREADYAKTIYSSGEALLSIIDDILDLSKIEAGVISFQLEDFSISDIVSEVTGIIRPRILNDQVKVNSHVSSYIPFTVKQDAGRFRQVLLNLVSNAVKFTEAGEIELRVEIEEEQAERLKICCTVRDTGIGIPPDKLESVFQPFQQADDSITRKYGGTGLGLPICKQIARLMGGDIWADSTLGEGSTFYFTAWVEKSTSQDSNKESTVIPEENPGGIQSRRSLHILLAEDNPINQKLARHIFHKTNHHLEIVEDGKQAVDVFLADPDKYDLIFMDIQMPEMDGFRATSEIRVRGFDKIPIVAMTAQSMKGDRQKCLDAGMNDYIPKPIRGELILKTIDKWV